MMESRVERILEHLNYDLASSFAESVGKVLRRLSDRDVNALYLSTHTSSLMGEKVDVWTAVLMPLIEREANLRRDIAMMPNLGPILAPELYQKGGAHDLPF